jgi:hypothetical protein
MFMPFRPLNHFRQKFFDVALVAYEVVVNDEDLAAPAQLSERV